jgi:transposase
MVVAPSLIPVKAGERVKTDRLDAAKLARLLRAGELHAVWVPDAAHEAMRDLVRSRTDAMQHLHTSRRQLLAFLLRQGRIYPGLKPWSRAHLAWLADQAFEHPAHQVVFQDYINAVHDGDRLHKQLIAMIETLVPAWSMKPLHDALCVMRGIDTVSAATILCATGDLRRFPTPGRLSAYFWSGAGPSIRAVVVSNAPGSPRPVTTKHGAFLTRLHGAIVGRRAWPRSGSVPMPWPTSKCATLHGGRKCGCAANTDT